MPPQGVNIASDFATSISLSRETLRPRPAISSKAHFVCELQGGWVFDPASGQARGPTWHPSVDVRERRPA